MTTQDLGFLRQGGITADQVKPRERLSDGGDAGDLFGMTRRFNMVQKIGVRKKKGCHAEADH